MCGLVPRGKDMKSVVLEGGCATSVCKRDESQQVGGEIAVRKTNTVTSSSATEKVPRPIAVNSCPFAALRTANGGISGRVYSIENRTCASDCRNRICDAPESAMATMSASARVWVLCISRARATFAPTGTMTSIVGTVGLSAGCAETCWYGHGGMSLPVAGGPSARRA